MFNLRNSIKTLAISNARSYRQVVDILPDVRLAIEQNKPIVALESTIITHGMPYPQNLETAHEVENLVRKQGAIPATIAIIDGRVKVGLSATELQKLAQMNHKDVVKCSRRDLSYVLSKNQSGGTTVAATMIIAHMVGLRVFATGGIGGVHRDGHLTMDVSADLIELGRTPLAVVCSGIKSILDIPKTLEYLETQGVCTVSYGSNDGIFPDFYTRSSGYKAPYSISTPIEAARMLLALQDISLKSGILIGVPIPKAFEANKQLIDAAIKEASESAKVQGISGKAITPFLLAAIAKITGGSSLQANIALIKNNASVAAQIACALSAIETRVDTNERTNNTKLPAPMIIGASILDLSLKIKEDLPEVFDGATYDTHVRHSAGGVARNLAEGIYKLYGNVKFLSIAGDDLTGKTLLQLMPQQLHQHIKVDNARGTSLCSVIFDKIGDCKLILGNMEIHEQMTPDLVQQHEIELSKAPLIVIDANVPLSTMAYILELARKYKRPVFYEPTDMRIACKPFNLSRGLTKQIKIISPNIYELKAIVERLNGNKVHWQPCINVDTNVLLCQVKALVLVIQEHFDCILVTLGPHGVLLSMRTNETAPSRFFSQKETYEYKVPKSAGHVIKFYPAPKILNLTNVSGAGDSFSSGFITGILRHYEIERAVALGFIAAERALKTASAVPKVYFETDEQQQLELDTRISQLQQQTI